MEAALRGLLLCLGLLLPSAGLPRQGGPGGEVSQLELALPQGLGLGAEEGRSQNATSQGREGPGAQLFLKPDPAVSCLQEGAIGWASSSPPLWPLGGLEGPVCRVRMDQDGPTPKHLEVVGVLTRYESGFIKRLRQRSSWERSDLETFGLCPAAAAGAALHRLQRVHGHAREPGHDLFLVLHLEEVTWGARAKLRFQMLLQAGAGRLLGELRVALLLFYPGSREGLGAGHREELLATGTGLLQEQSLCLAKGTRYLVLGADVGSISRSHDQLSFEASLAIRTSREGGALLSPTETQQLLFGSDDKCFTRMTPVLLLLAKSPRRDEVVLATSSYLSADGVLDVAPYPQLSLPEAGAEELLFPPGWSQANASLAAPDSGSSSSEFLANLTSFIRRVLSSPSEPPTEPSSQHWLDFQLMETLPHQLLNLSEAAALEQLVQSEEPSVLLFPQDSGAVLERHLGDWQPEDAVLQLLTGKLQAVIGELRDVPAFRANLGLLRRLLSFCYFPPAPGAGRPPARPGGAGRLRALLLLKALQTVRARWRERRRVQRQNRSARPQAHGRLQELTVDLRDRKFVIMPAVYAANNCEGPCRLPLSTRAPGYHSHTVLLLGMQERGSPLQRAPCCVPVRYSDQLIISLSADGLEIRKFPNMVAEECGCR
ncbi:MIS factor, partial [Rhinopomastus cyanomelas]|nr:MIS factor [Rhinopomastus cyanomelas]